MEGMLHREHHISFDRETITNEVPIGIQLVNEDEQGLLWVRQVGKCVRRVDQDGDKPFVCRDGKVHSHARFFDAQRVGIRQIQFGGGARGSVTTDTSLASTVPLDRIVPVIAKDNCARWWMHRRSIHFLF